MSIFNINTKPIDLNKFWATTPIFLKYLIFAAFVSITSYLLLIRKNDSIQLKELEKIEQKIETTFTVIEKFEEFQNLQIQYNELSDENIENLYHLILELNDNNNTKLNYIIINSKYDKNIIDKINILDKSFDKLCNAYEPKINDEK
jgi:hypothetical protein